MPPVADLGGGGGGGGGGLKTSVIILGQTTGEHLDNIKAIVFDRFRKTAS